MQVPYNHLPAQFADPDPILASIKELVLSTKFTLGGAVEEFERLFSEALGARHAIGVNSGTDAIFLSLRASGIGPGDEVITVSGTFIATVGAIVQAGATPVFVDVNAERNMDVSKIEAAITERTRAILPVHWAGVPADMPEILEIAKRHGLWVFEDSAQGIGARLDGKSAGTFGRTGSFSLHPLKNVNVWGDGGVIVTDDDALADSLRLLRNHGLSHRDTVEHFAYNSRLDALQAVVGQHVIGALEETTSRRRAHAAQYDTGLAAFEGKIRIPPRDPRKQASYHLYIVESEDRDGLIAYLKDQGIGAKVHYPVPVHLQPATRALGLDYSEGSLPVTEAQARSVVSFPVHQHLEAEQIAYVIEKVGEFHGF